MDTERALALLENDGFTPESRLERTVGSVADFADVVLSSMVTPAAQHKRQGLFLMNPDRIWAYEGRVEDHGGLPIRGKIHHNVAKSALAVPLDAIIGKMRRVNVQNALFAHLFDFQKLMTQAQPGGDWRPIAVAIRTREAKRLESEPNPEYEANVSHADIKTSQEAARVTQRTRRRPVLHRWLDIHIVWAEIVGAEMYDRLFVERGNKSNQNHRFYQTKLLEHAPFQTRAIFRECEERHRSFMKRQFPGGVPESVLGDERAASPQVAEETGYTPSQERAENGIDVDLPDILALQGG